MQADVENVPQGQDQHLDTKSYVKSSKTSTRTTTKGVKSQSMAAKKSITSKKSTARTKTSGKRAPSHAQSQSSKKSKSTKAGGEEESVTVALESITII